MLFIVSPFSRKSMGIGPFVFLSTVSTIFFADSYAQNVFFTGEAVSFHFKDCLFNSGS